MKTFSEFDSVSGEKKTMPIGSQKDLARMYICNNLFLFTPGFSHEIFIITSSNYELGKKLQVCRGSLSRDDDNN